jgi:F-type H+-transporting ATPase subunit gamma
MANLRNLNQRITSLRNMQKVMRAMDMIATIKLRKLFRLQGPITRFDRAIDEIPLNIVRSLKHTVHPFIRGFKPEKKVHAVIFTSDKGLCGSHNNSIQKAMDVLMGECAEKGIEADVTCIGLKGANHCRRRGYTVRHQTESNERVLVPGALREISFNVFDRIKVNEIQKIYLVFNRFISTIHQETETALIVPFAPVKAPKNPESVKGTTGFSTEPPQEEYISSATRLYLFYKIRAALAYSYLSEQASRMTAMENATNNSEDLINRYISLQNRARQSTITSEIIEIISGKEALKG